MLVILALSLLFTSPLVVQASSQVQGSLDTFDALIASLEKHPGFESHVRIGYDKDGLRGLYATRDIPAEESVLTIPDTAIMNVGGGTSLWADSTCHFLSEYKNPRSRFRAYFDTLPKPHEVSSIANIPKEYYNLIPAGEWLDMYQEVQDWTLKALSTESVTYDFNLAEAIGLEMYNITLEEIRYACALVGTRAVSGAPRETTFLLPVFDMANHRADCPIYLASTDDTSYLTSDSDVKEGDEICYNYKDDGRDDAFVFYYGYLPAPENPPHLMSIDVYNESEPLDSVFEGELQDYADETVRLKTILAEIDARDWTHPEPAPIPGQEYIHGVLKGLKKRRRLAIVVELEQIEKVVATILDQ